jgi:peptidoglycan/xylan/chitin deacetylase (PgdA/CDA1 family)
MNKISRILKNPFVIVTPFVVLLLLLWQQYSSTSASPQRSVAETNILPNAKLDDIDKHGFPVGWQLSRADPMVTVTTLKGRDSPTILTLTNTSDTMSGNTTLTSPVAPIHGGGTYYYKAFYKSNTPFDLLLRTNFKDGSYEQAIIGRFDPSTEWGTVSHVFTPSESAQSVQFIYSVASKGELQIDNIYLEPNPLDVYIKPQPKLGNNLIPNASLSSSNATAPDNWNAFTYGDNVATSTYIASEGSPYVQTRLADYKTGEVKWQYDPVPIKAGHSFQFGVTYRSDVSVDVVAEYTLKSGKRHFETVKDLLPAKDWTMYKGTFEAPADATSLLVTLVLQKNGTVDMTAYSLYDITKPGEVTWAKPHLSVTFDDGWESAFTNGAALMNRYGYEGTFYLNPSTIDTTSFMTSGQVAELRGNGHELASHGYEHVDFTTLDRSAIDYQLGHSYEYFKQVHGIQTVDFAVPFGGSDAQTIFYARKYYRSLRGTESGVNTRQNIDAYNLRVLYMGRDTSLDKLLDAISDTKAKNGWLILVYHRIEATGNGETIMTPAQFQQQLDTVKASGVTVQPVDATLQDIDGWE